jgi:hypothetical protein
MHCRRFATAKNLDGSVISRLLAEKVVLIFGTAPLIVVGNTHKLIGNR